MTAELERWRRETHDPLLDADKLQMLVAESREQSEKAKTSGRANMVWRYPEYLFGAPSVRP
jgi:muconolactone delta-isomerase